MRIAFYAPMKPPTDPVPSGDRRMARLLIQALRAGGHEVALASRFRSVELAGEAGRQERLRRHGARLAARYIDRHRRRPPEAWFTYHLYHKAPDWLGPAVAAAFDIPYLVAEASTAEKQQGGAWHLNHESCCAAIRQASRVLCLNPEDRPALGKLLGGERKLIDLPPFLETPRFAGSPARRAAARRDLATRLDLPREAVWIATVARLRGGAKQRSLALMAEAVRRLAVRRDLPDWRWIVLGDGPEAGAARALFADSPAVCFAGGGDQAAVRRLLFAADLVAWPAIRESYGMALLEAQASGVPVVAADRPGIAAIVAHGTTGLLAPEGDAGAFANAVACMLRDGTARRAAGQAAARRAAERHDLAIATTRLDGILREIATEGDRQCG